MTDVFFIMQTKILLFFVANFFILTIFLSFLIWLIFMDNSFPICKKGRTVGQNLWQQDLHVQDQIVKNLNIRMVPAIAQ